MIVDFGNYCPKCGSKLFPGDLEPMSKYGVCNYCYTYDPKYKEMRNMDSFRLGDVVEVLPGNGYWEGKRGEVARKKFPYIWVRIPDTKKDLTGFTPESLKIVEKGGRG